MGVRGIEWLCVRGRREGGREGGGRGAKGAKGAREGGGGEGGKGREGGGGGVCVDPTVQKVSGARLRKEQAAGDRLQINQFTFVRQPFCAGPLPASAAHSMPPPALPRRLPPRALPASRSRVAAGMKYKDKLSKTNKRQSGLPR